MKQSASDEAGLEPGAPFRDVNREVGFTGPAHDAGVPRSGDDPSGPTEVESAEIPPTGEGPTRPMRMPSLGNRLLCVPIKLFWGMIFCQSVLGALAVIGWTYRLMGRSVLKQWWKASVASTQGDRFASFAAVDPRTHEHVHWPNWFLAQNFRERVRDTASSSQTRNDSRRNGPDAPAQALPVKASPLPETPAHRLGHDNPNEDPHSGRSLRLEARRPAGRHPLAKASQIVKALFASLWLNVRLGVQGIFNTWVLTLPACVLMFFGWYDGWNNSSHKGYEQFSVGPGVSVSGILLFIAAMFYLPLAQARQAVTGNWRSFYNFRLVWTLVRRRWLACFGLATLYAACSVPMTILTSVVMFLPNINPKLADLTPAETVRVLNRFYFWSALFFLPAFVLVRLVAARIYGSTLLKAVQTGAIGREALATRERQALHRLGLLQIQPPRPRHPVLRIVLWAGTRAGRITFGLLTFLAWFTFVAQLYIAQFFNYIGSQSWLNLPLIQLPWFHHLPATLKNPWSDFILAAVLVFISWRLRRFVVWLRTFRSR